MLCLTSTLSNLEVHADVSLQVQKCNNVLENYTNNCANKTADMQL